MGYAEINVYLPLYLDFTSSRRNHNIIPETLQTWTLDWTGLDGGLDSGLNNGLNHWTGIQNTRAQRSQAKYLMQST